MLVYIFFILLVLISYSLGLSSIEFLGEFGGKGTIAGKFGDEIYLAFNCAGDIIFSDTQNAKIQIWNEQGVFMKEIVSSDQVTLHSPKNIAVDKDGNIYVIDWNSYFVPVTTNPKIYEYVPCIHIFTIQGKFIRTIILEEITIKKSGLQSASIIVDNDGEYALSIKKNHTRELKIAVDLEKNIYVLDIEANSISKYKFNGEKKITFGKYGDGNGELDSPKDIVVDIEGNVYIADKNNHRIVKFNSNGEYLLSFGKNGLAGSEFKNPYYLSISLNNEILVKDMSQYQKKFENHPFSDEKGINFLEGELFRFFEPNVYEIKNLKTRLQTLEKKQEKEEKKVDEIQEIAPEKYTKIIERIQVFSLNGKIENKIIYTIDKNDPNLHNLDFLGIDGFNQKLYLMNKDKNSIRQYKLNGSSFNLENVDTGIITKVEQSKDVLKEDSVDLDEDIDYCGNQKTNNVKSVISLNYQFSERWNLLSQGKGIYSESLFQDFNQSKPIYDYERKNKATDLVGNMVLKYISNPNIYKYTEAKIYLKTLKGETDYQGKALHSELSKKRISNIGEAQGMLCGVDIDLTPNSNLVLEYVDMKPNDLSRNFKMTSWDVGGENYYGRSSLYDSYQKIGVEFKIKW
ncbi:MAG: NHL repeat-containing protein [bacterium]